MAHFLASGSRIKQYVIDEKIGEGNTGTVYRAKVEGFNRTVAIKVLYPHLLRDKKALTRFRREASAASQLNHPHLLSLYDFGRHQDMYYLVMNYLEGGSLALHLRGGAFSTERAVEIARQLGQGLLCVHEEEIVLRDLRPGNILFHDGRPVISDFGLAFQEGMPSVTQVGSQVGNPLYSSPEQIRMEELDDRTDIYSLGAILYEMVTGHPPFPEDISRAEVVTLVLEGRRIPFSRWDITVPVDLQRIILQAMKVDPNDRYQYAEELVEDLECFSSGKSLEYAESLTESGRLRVRPRLNRDRFSTSTSRSVIFSIVGWMALGFGLLGGLIYFLTLPKETEKKKAPAISALEKDLKEGGKEEDKGEKKEEKTTSLDRKKEDLGKDKEGKQDSLISGKEVSPSKEAKKENENENKVSSVDQPGLQKNVNWKPVWGGKWQGKKGVITGWGRGQGPLDLSALLSKKRWKNFYLALEIKMVSGSPGTYAGLALGGKDLNNVFLVYLGDERKKLNLTSEFKEKWYRSHSEYPKMIIFGGIREGKFQIYRRTLLPFSRHSWVSLAVKREDTSLTVWVNGQRIGKLKGRSFPGFIGFIKFGNTKVHIRNFQLRLLK